MGHYELRFLDRYRTCRNADLCDFVFAAPEMANVDQSFGRSDDVVRGNVRRDFPGHSRRACLDGVVSRAGLEQLRHLAELPQPLDVDVFAVSTYFTVSVLFWYTGLIPDLA